MLALRSSGIKTEQMISKFGTKWLVDNKNYLVKLEAENYLTKQNGLIKLTKNGYAVCDEIIKNLT